MDVVENLVKSTLGEMEKVLTTRTVVGEPFTIDGRTVVPLICIGFGFGAGGGEGKGGGETGKEKGQGEGQGGGTGGGAWIKPVALLISDKDGIRVESIKGGLSSVLEKLGETIPDAMERCMEKWAERKKEG